MESPGSTVIVLQGKIGTAKGKPHTELHTHKCIDETLPAVTEGSGALAQRLIKH